MFDRDTGADDTQELFSFRQGLDDVKKKSGDWEWILWYLLGLLDGGFIIWLVMTLMEKQ